MTDFGAAFNEGIAAAKAAETAKREIDDVFVNLDRQIGEASDGKIGIRLQSREVTDPPLLAMVNFFKNKVAAPKETYTAIVAYNRLVGESSTKELARWTQGRGGYPCKIVYGSIEYSCEDRESLENGLLSLLRDPIIGERMWSLLALKPQEKTQESEEKRES